MASLASLDSTPCRVTVAELVRSRYGDCDRPEDWDQRTSGIDTVRTSDGRVIRLRSDGGQNPPQAGWVLLVSDGDHNAGYRWTLYGIPRNVTSKSCCHHNAKSCS